MFERRLAQALESAILLSGGAAHAPLLRGFEQAVSTLLDADPALAALWERVRAGPEPGAVGSFVERMRRSETAWRAARPAVEIWLHHAQLVAMGSGEHTNALSDSAQVWGANVQAREIHGGIHLHGLPDAAPRGAPTPRQLPATSAHFVGRDADLSELDDNRAAHRPGAPQLIVVSGPPGVGKSTLVARWLGGIAQEFPDGQLFADLGGHGPEGLADPGDVLGRFLRSLGAASVPGGLAEKAALWRSLTSTVRLAILLDDAFTAAQVRPLLPGSASCLVVVTSRRRLTGLALEGAVSHQLGALDPDTAMELLSRGGGGARVADDRQAARNVVDLCARLPLAICLAAAHLAVRPKKPLATMAEHLSDGGTLFDTLTADGEGAVRAALDASYRSLPTEAAALYRVLGLLPATSLEGGLIAALAEPAGPRAARGVDALLEASLLEQLLEDDTYRFHDLVRAHARERADAESPPEDRELVLRRFVGWCLARADAADQLITPSHHVPRDPRQPTPDPAGFRTAREALAWLTRQLGSLMAAVRHCAAAGWHTECWQLVDAMHPVFTRLRPTEQRIEAHELGAAAARADGADWGLGRMLTSGGAAFRDAGRHQEAARWYQEALTLAVDSGDQRQRAQAYQGLGNARLRLGELPAARDLLERALALRAEIGYQRGVALSRVSLAEVAMAEQGHDQAVALLGQARRELLAVRDAHDAARALALLGFAHGQLGERRAAEEALWQALGEFEAVGSAPWRARTWEMLGQVAERHGATEEAAQRYERSRTLYEPLSVRDTDRLTERLAALRSG
ncbi:tetratricopeptide repeat protein [Streptomyces sp. DSM 44915]|uniref:Tetratricopeptide repeat protein n=1 Tax=Streptomyces chisholmiae TaxID=3075540 RepID=A0ABU2JTF9_9ACTN|nr:tetratricopeptide repeat protein [Streptomyces sp. DSM 44915]MDT0268018.1 tetratricopeptide repeat protein [Streptomyces sp. DSM 44915]